jgi:hypothetical protein
MLKKTKDRSDLKIYYTALKSIQEDTFEGDEFQMGDCFSEEQAKRLEKDLHLGSQVYQVGMQHNAKLGELKREWKSGSLDIHEVAKKNDEALDRIICTAVKVLRAKGHGDEANKLQQEHGESYATAVSDLCSGVVRTGIGDHRPLSEWLARVYDKLESKLGKFVMEATRLKDIKIFNYCIPVVFNPKGDPKINPLKAWGLDEYAVHFVALISVIAYWVSWAVCTGLTWGMGAISFFCNLPAMGIEKLVAAKVAPNWAKRVYLRANPNEVLTVSDIDFDYVAALV